MKGKVMDIDVITKKITDFENRISAIEAIPLSAVSAAIKTSDVTDILAGILDRLTAIESAVFPTTPAAPIKKS